MTLRDEIIANIAEEPKKYVACAKHFGFPGKIRNGFNETFKALVSEGRLVPCEEQFAKAPSKNLFLATWKAAGKSK